MTFADRDGLIWLDGDLVPWRNARVHGLTHSLHYGTGVFEGLRAYQTPHGTCIFRLREHTERLFRSAEIMHMQIPFDRVCVERAQCEVVRANGLREAYIRPICFFGADEMGLHAENLSVHLMIASWEWPPYLGDTSDQQGISMKTVQYRRMTDSPLNEAKACGPYAVSVASVREATLAGMDEGLLLDTEGRVAEGSGQNIFIVKDGLIYTPLTDNCLAGITRASIMELAHAGGLKVTEKHVELSEVQAADEVFLTGTATEVAAVGSVDGTIIGSGGCGPITRILQEAYRNEVQGSKAQFPYWRAPIQ